MRRRPCAFMPPPQPRFNNSPPTPISRYLNGPSAPIGRRGRRRRNPSTQTLRGSRAPQSPQTAVRRLRAGPGAAPHVCGVCVCARAHARVSDMVVYPRGVRLLHTCTCVCSLRDSGPRCVHAQAGLYPEGPICVPGGPVAPGTRDRLGGRVAASVLSLMLGAQGTCSGPRGPQTGRGA